MPIRVIQTGSPRSVFDDSNASPFMPAIAQAGNTLLELGPKLAQIRMQQEAAARQNAQADREFGLQSRRVDYEGDRLGLDKRRINADIRGTATKSILGMIGSGANPQDLSASPDMQESGLSSSVLAPIGQRAAEDRANDLRFKTSQIAENEANAKYRTELPGLLRQQHEEQAAAKAAEDATRRRAQDALIHRTAVANVAKSLGDVTSAEAQQYRALMATDQAKAMKYQSDLIERNKEALDPEYLSRKQSEFLKQLSAMGPQ